MSNCVMGMKRENGNLYRNEKKKNKDLIERGISVQKSLRNTTVNRNTCNSDSNTHKHNIPAFS